MTVFDRLSADEKKHFADTFEDIVNSVDAGEGPAPMMFEDDPTERRRHQLEAVPKADAAAK
jgi:hypothetical protein